MNLIYQIRVQFSAEGSDAPRPGTWPLRFQAPDGSWFVPQRALEQARSSGLQVEVLREIPEKSLPVRFILPHDGAVMDPPPRDARLAVLSRLLSEGRADGSVLIRFLGRNHSVPPDGFALDRVDGRRRYVWQVVPAHDADTSTLHERFSALRSLCDPERARVVLSLGSGGLKLFAHATALRLLEGIGCAERVEEVWGSSAGAMAGLMYSLGLSPHAIEQMGFDLYAGRFDLELRPSKLQFLRRLVQDTLLSSERPAAAGFVDCADGLGRMLAQYCAEVEPKLPFYCPAFNVGTCRTEVLTSEHVPPHLSELIIRTDPREAALASSTVPLLFVPRVVRRGDEEAHYVDGSTTEDVPLHSVVRKWHLDRAAGLEKREHLVILYVKLTASLDAHRTSPRRIGKLRMLQTVASAGIDTMHQRDLELAASRSDVTLLGLELDDASPDFFETGLIPEYIRAAKESFPLQLAALEARLRGEDAA